jgi:hypothetical protein
MANLNRKSVDLTATHASVSSCARDAVDMDRSNLECLGPSYDSLISRGLERNHALRYPNNNAPAATGSGPMTPRLR